MADRVVKVTLTAQVAGYVSEMEKAARKTRETTQDATQRLAQQQAAMEKVGGAALKMGAVSAAGLALTAKAAIDWQTAWTGVTKTVDGTPEQLAAIESGLRGLARELPASHAQIAAVAEAAGQLGVQADSVVEFTKVMVDLGETTNLSADEAATSIAQLMNVMQTAPADVDRVGAALVALGNDGASTERDIVQMSQRIAGAGKIIGLTEGEVLGFSNALASVGIDAEAGGSAISRVMTDIAKSVSAGGDEVAGFAKVAGMSAADFSKAFKEDPADAIASFVEGLGGINDAGGDVFTTLSDLGQSDIRVSNALLGMANAGDLLRDSLELGNQSWADNTALATEAEKRYATVEAQLGKTQGAINDAAISLGSTMLPAISDTAEAVADFAGWMADLPEPVLAVGAGVVALTTGVALFGGGLLLLAPRIVATRVAMGELNLTGKNLAKTVGRGGALMLGLAVIGAGLAGAGSKAELTAEQLAQLKAATDRLDLGDLDELFKGAEEGSRAGSVGISGFKGALDGLTSSDFFENRNANKVVGGFFDSITGNVFNLSGDLKKFEAQFNSMGETLAEVATNDFSVANDKFQEYIEKAGGGEEATRQLLEAMPAYEAKLIELAAAQGGATDEQSILNLAMGEGETASQLAKEASEKNAESLRGVSAAANDASGEVSDFAAQLRDFGSATLDARAAQRELESAVDDAKAALEENGQTLDINTEAGRKNQAALDGIASSAADAAAATWEHSGSEDDLAASLRNSRQRLIDQAVQFGMTESAAKDYADQVLATPEEVRTSVKLQGIGEADRQLAELTRTRVMSINVRANMPDLNGVVSGNGRFGTFADGGTVYGPGTSKSDSIIARLSVGEEVTPEPQASKYRSLLKAIADDRLPGYAYGGTAQSSYAPAPQYTYAPHVSAGGGGQRPVEFSFTTINPVAETTTESTRKAGQLIGASLGV